jgi:hypothetical protein
MMTPLFDFKKSATVKGIFGTLDSGAKIKKERGGIDEKRESPLGSEGKENESFDYVRGQRDEPKGRPLHFKFAKKALTKLSI